MKSSETRMIIIMVPAIKLNFHSENNLRLIFPEVSVVYQKEAEDQAEGSISKLCIFLLQQICASLIVNNTLKI